MLRFLTAGESHGPSLTVIIEGMPAGWPVDLAAINALPPVSWVWKAVGWSIPALVVLALAWIGFTQGAAVAGQSLWFWVVATGVPCMIGAVLALAHPLVIVSAFAVAPVTTLNPLIGAGHVLALLQAYLRPPVLRVVLSVALAIVGLVLLVTA